jgi:hypothetical protein
MKTLFASTEDANLDRNAKENKKTTRNSNKKDKYTIFCLPLWCHFWGDNWIFI